MEKRRKRDRGKGTEGKGQRERDTGKETQGKRHRERYTGKETEGRGDSRSKIERKRQKGYGGG